MDNTIRIWEVKTGKSLKTLEGHAGPVLSVMFSPDGRHLASGGADGIACVWDLADGGIIARLEGHTGPVESVAYTSDHRLLTGGLDSTLRLWDVDNEQQVGQLQGGENSILFMLVSNDRLMAVTGDTAGDVRVYDLTSSAVPWSFHVSIDESDLPEGQHRRPIAEMALAPDGTLFVLTGAGGTQIWDTRSHRELHFTVPETAWDGGIAVTPDKSRLIYWSQDTLGGYALGASQELFQAHLAVAPPVGKGPPEIGKLVKAMFLAPHLYCLAVSPDGGTMAAGCGPVILPGSSPKEGDNAIRLFSSPP